MNDDNVEKVHKLKEIYYINEREDYRHVKDGTISLKEWMKEFRMASACGMYCSGDQRPFIRQYIKIPDRVVIKSRKVKSYIKGIITSNIGIIHLYRNSLQIIGDYKLNIMNTQSLEFYQSEISIPTLSMELNRTEIKDILRKNKGNNAYVIYGKPELMISEYCPIGSTFGGRKTNVDCNAICTRDKFTLIDRVNERLRVMTDLFCRSYILNPVPLNLFDERTYLKEAGIKTLRFDFRDESYEEVKNVYNMYLSKMEYDKSNYTKGQFRRGIE